MNSPEIRALAAVYRGGMPYVPPRDAEERRDFNASSFMAEYNTLVRRYINTAYRLSSKDADGNEIPSPSATAVDQQEYVEALRDVEEARDALRADFYRRKVERLEGRSVEVRDIHLLVARHLRTLHAREFRDSEAGESR